MQIRSRKLHFGRPLSPSGGYHHISRHREPQMYFPATAFLSPLLAVLLLPVVQPPHRQLQNHCPKSSHSYPKRAPADPESPPGRSLRHPLPIVLGLRVKI